MVLGAGPVVQFVMITLLFFSVFSWAIIFHKFLYFRRISKETKAFLSFINKHSNLSLCYQTAKRYKTPFARIFSSAYEKAQGAERFLSSNPSSISQVKHSLEKKINKLIGEEIKGTNRALPFLATTGNTTPFIGLFGTVWGIMDSFREIGHKGSANLAVVAPGISEALIATAMGLFAAIPAVVAYNYYLYKVRNLSYELEDFAEAIVVTILNDLRRKKKENLSVG